MHVCWTEPQRKTAEGKGKENAEEKHSNSLLAHGGAATMMGHISKLQDFYWTYSGGYMGQI